MSAPPEPTYLATVELVRARFQAWLEAPDRKRRELSRNEGEWASAAELTLARLVEEVVTPELARTISAESGGETTDLRDVRGAVTGEVEHWLSGWRP